MVHRRTIAHETNWFLSTVIVLILLCAARAAAAPPALQANTAHPAPSKTASPDTQGSQKTAENLPVGISKPNQSPPQTGTAPIEKGVDKADSQPALSEVVSSPVKISEPLRSSGGPVREKLPKSQNADPKDKTDLAQTSLEPGPTLWRTMFALAAVLTLIVFSTYLFRRFALGARHRRGAAAIEIIARSPVNPKQSMCLVRLGGRIMLVGLSPNHMATLITLDDPDEISRLMGQLEKQSPDSITQSFERLFRREARDYDQSDDHDPDDHPDESDPSFEYDNPPQQQQWNHARGELSSLLNKVKGLARLRSRS